FSRDWSSDVCSSDLLDRLEYMYEKSRDISYDTDDMESNRSFENEIANLIKSFTHEKLKLFIIGNDDVLWNKISKNIKEELLSILQELLVNMRKHSGANELIIRFELISDKLHIHYSDNGVGLLKILIKEMDWLIRETVLKS